MQKTLQHDVTDNKKDTRPHAVGAGISVAMIILVGIYYLFSVRETLFSTNVGTESFRFLMNIVIVLACVEIITPVMSFLSGYTNTKLSERHALVIMRATRNAHLILSMGVILSFELASMSMNAFQMANILLMFFILSEMVKHGTRMLFYLYPGIISQDADM
ncbi:MAG: hypothetical protein AAFN11_01510 [Chloroflexota bacterium]